MEKPFYISQLPEKTQKWIKEKTKENFLNDGMSEEEAEQKANDFLDEKVYTAEETFGKDFWKSIDAIKDNFTPPGAKGKKPSFDAYMDARRKVEKLRDTYKKQKEDYDNAQRMGWKDKAKEEGSVLDPMYGLKPNNFENTDDYKKYVDTIKSFEKANDYPSWLDENPFETMYTKEVKEDIDTNDNGKIEKDEMADFQKSLDDYASKNKKGRDDIPVTTRR